MSPTLQRRATTTGNDTPSSGPDFKTMIAIQLAQALITAFLASSASEPALARAHARTTVSDSKAKSAQVGAPKLVSVYRQWYGSRHFNAATSPRAAA